MTLPIYALLVGMLLGFSLTIPPGPMNALIVARSVRSPRAGTVTGMGAMSADLVLGAIVYGLRSEVDLGSYFRPICALGAVAMAFLAYRLVGGAARAAEAPPKDLASYSQALAVGISNPLQILWWLTAGLAFAYLGGIVLFLGIFLAIAIWIVAFPRAVHAGTRRFPRAQRGVTIASGAVLFAFAGYFVFLAL